MSTVTLTQQKERAALKIPGVNFTRIVSIFPLPCRHEIHLIKQRDFYLPAAPRDDWTWLDVYDDSRSLPDYSTVGEQNPTPVYRPVGEPSGRLAECLVDYWTTGMVVRVGRPGIAALPLNEEIPSEDLLATLRSEQSTFFNAWVTLGSDLHQKGEGRNINEMHRAAALWLYGSGAQRLPWYTKRTYEETKKCLGCARDILADATVCEHCHLNLVDHYVKYKLDPTEDQAVARFLARVTAQRVQPPQDSDGPETQPPKASEADDSLSEPEPLSGLSPKQYARAKVWGGPK